MKYDSGLFLNIILSIYERRTTNRAIPINRVVKAYHQQILYKDKKKDEIPTYEDVDVEDFYEINEALQVLQSLDFITIQAKDGWIKSMKVVEEHITQAYEWIQTVPKTVIDQQICSNIETHVSMIHTSWIKQFLKDEMIYLKEKRKLHSKYWNNLKYIDDILKILVYIDGNKRSYIRQMSQTLYHDSKYFEEKIKHKFLNIVRQYEPHCIIRKQEDDEMIESEIFAYLGILLYPQVFSLYGNVDIIYDDDSVIHVSCKQGSWYMDSDMLVNIQQIRLHQIKEILCIENKANYIDYIRNHAREDQLVLYAQGHYSPQKEKFYQLFVSDDIQVSLWSDIDLGGFSMFVRLQQIFPNLQPYRMDLCTYHTYVETGKPISIGYEEKLMKLLDHPAYTLFYEVIQAIVQHHKTIEQEVMIKETIITS